MTRSERAIMANTAHAQSEPPGVRWRSALGGFWSRDEPAIVNSREGVARATKGERRESIGRLRGPSLHDLDLYSNEEKRCLRRAGAEIDRRLSGVGIV